ncbi:MAG: D-glycerate dehydrogenase [Synergistaceae bacterium]|nr:D-glycerate dehydrogenase [Synergistaceae bacterium]MBQ3764991.1 D-glycerate dehydrogenase [Synergistaceae bacterium]MBQ6113229.1 D-glycerate dehydrogenase [Synergistaceae bacterium]MBQ6918896.1 D-glycerate dehydrogenase [Synergistaceae bacterium]MBQ6969225.1 D-glycerate dehydrogenase [Synergistaceae bacterium]
MNKKVYVTRTLPTYVMKTLGNICEYDVNSEERLATREELVNAFKNYAAVITMLNDRIDADLINQAGPDLKLIANYGVGFNNIDVAAANAKGIFVTNTPDVLTDATADTAFTLMFACARRVIECDNIVRTGSFMWAPKYMLGYDVTGRTVGIIGAGRIGTNFGIKAARGFNMKVLYYSRRASLHLESVGAQRVGLEELLERSDFVSLHLPLTDSTRHLIGARELAKMKPEGILINTSRGPVVDEKALADALSRHVIAGAGLDVYENEPEVEPALKTLNNVVLLPHIGTATFGTRREMGLMVIRNIEAVFAGKEPPQMVRV